jgi:hypothetical protein
MKNKFVLVPLLTGIVVASSSAFGADPISNFRSSIDAYVGVGPATTTVYSVGGANNFVYSAPFEYGDQITIAGGAGQVVSSISFDYYANYGQVGGLTFSIYKQDGPGGSPGTLDYTKTMDILNGGATATINFAYDAGNALDSTFTYAVKFDGATIAGANIAGLISPDALATIGSSANDIWEKDGGVWVNRQLVPEPSTVALFSVASVAVVGALFGRRNRK